MNMHICDIVCFKSPVVGMSSHGSWQNSHQCRQFRPWPENMPDGILSIFITRFFRTIS